MTKTVREFSRCGPCLTLGALVKETPRFYFFDAVLDRFGGPVVTGKVMKETLGHYSPAHVEPCPSCRDHAKTQYPEGYMD